MPLRLALTAIFAATLMLVPVRESFAIPFFFEVFTEKYANSASEGENVKKLVTLAEANKCNVCHIDGQPKKERNAYGTALSEHLDKGKFGKPRLETEREAAVAEVIAAFDKVAEVKLVADKEDSPTFGANLAAGSLPAATPEPPKEEPKPEPKPEPMPAEEPMPQPETTPAETPQPAAGNWAELLKNEIKQELKAELTAELGKVLREELGPELRSEISSQLATSLKSDMRSSIKRMLMVEMNPIGEIDDATEEAAIAEVTKLGGRVTKVAQTSDDKVVSFHLSDQTIGDDALALVRKIRGVVEVNVQGTEVGDAGVKHLVGLPTIRRLNLAKTKVTDEALPYLAVHEELTYLNLYGTQVSDAGIASLASLPNLAKLYLWQTQATEEGAKQLEGEVSSLDVNLGY
ncbi:MAG: hypothetical protein WDZ51_15025 [Pirellulaceae bacterium]